MNWGEPLGSLKKLSLCSVGGGALSLPHKCCCQERLLHKNVSFVICASGMCLQNMTLGGRGKLVCATQFGMDTLGVWGHGLYHQPQNRVYRRRRPIVLLYQGRWPVLAIVRHPLFIQLNSFSAYLIQNQFLLFAFKNPDGYGE